MPVFLRLCNKQRTKHIIISSKIGVEYIGMIQYLINGGRAYNDHVSDDHCRLSRFAH